MMDAPTLVTTRKPNPTEAIELGARVTFLLDEEQDVIAATKHYESCQHGGCQFCHYGPIEDMKSYLHRLRFFREDMLGDAWFF
jgi:hypothetical protein